MPIKRLFWHFKRGRIFSFNGKIYLPGTLLMKVAVEIRIRVGMVVMERRLLGKWKNSNTLVLMINDHGGVDNYCSS